MSKSYLRTSSAPSGLVLFSLAGLVALTTSPALAKSKPDAGAVASADEESNDPCLLDGLCRAHYLRARSLSRDGNFDGALAAYEAAYRRRAVPWLLISIGRTLHKLGRPADAIKQYERYRQDDKNPNPTRLERVAEYTKQAESDLAAAPKPLPPVAANPSAPVAPTPAGGTPPKPASDSDSGKTAQVASDTTAGGSKTPPAPAGKPPDPLVARGTAAGEPGSAATPPSPSRWKWNGLWAGLGVSGGFLLLGGALGIAAQASSSQLRGTNYVGSNPSPDVVALQDRIRGLAIAADTFFVATAVSVGVTLALTLTRKPAAEPRPSRQLPGLEDLGPPPAAGSPAPPAPTPAAPTPAAPAVSAPAPAPAAGASAKPEPAASPAPASKSEPASTSAGSAKPEDPQAPAASSKPASETTAPAAPTAQSGGTPGAAASAGAPATAPSASPAPAATAASPSPAPVASPREGSPPATQTSPPSAPGAP